MFCRSVKHRCLRVMVFGHAKTGKSTLVSRLTSKRVQTTQWISVTTHSQALNIVKWVYAPYSASEHIRFIMWDFDNQVKLFAVSHYTSIPNIILFRMFLMSLTITSTPSKDSIWLCLICWMTRKEYRT